MKRRLPGRFGGRPVLVSPDASLKFLGWRLEKRDRILFSVADEFVRAGDVVLDIGANVGLFTFAAADRAGSRGNVLALEPDIWLCGLLRRTAGLRRNRDLRVDVLPVAVADRGGLAQFCIAARGRATSHLREVCGSSQTGGVREVHWVPLVTLDWLFEEYGRPDVVKIDVEGAEHLVLRGGGRLLHEARPVLFCEVSSECLEEVTAVLKEARYALFDADEERPRKQIDRVVWNTVAVPVERAG